MLRWLFTKFSRILITLRVSILSIFITLFVLAIVIVTGVTYVRFAGAIEKVSFKFMREVSMTVYNGIVSEINDVAIESKFSANLFQRGILSSDNQQEIVDYTYDVMRLQTKTLPSVQSAFWGDEQGNFILASKLDDHTIASDIVNRKEKDIREVIFRNLQGVESHHHTVFGLDYDPRVRPWYQNAKAKGSLIWTDVYPYHTGLLGVTAATPVYRDGNFVGVFALNVRLDYLRHFLEMMKVSKHGIVYIVSVSGNIISIPGMEQYENSKLSNVSSANIPWLTESFALYQKNHQQEFVFLSEGERYLAVYLPLPEFTPHVWMVGVVVPEKDFTYELINTNYLVLFVGFMMLVLGIFLISMLVTRVVNPLKKLVIETENIKHFELQETQPIRSRIKEIFYLSNAIAAMKKGLRSFQKYVPASLVRNLIETGKDSTIGGEKKTLAIFFSDIENFTAIADHMDPNQLMEYMCDYFNELTHIITESQGTLDKYIGDSIMAFWGAPIPVDEACIHAARAILLCKKRLGELYLKWQSEGHKIFKTRMGLHFGEVVVGNLGSSERLSYTAVGDAINITSRLEALNKIYGTQIIVSDAFYREVKKHFILRKIDCVVVKGKEQSMTIYELLAEDKAELSFDSVAYQTKFKRAFSLYQHQKWEEAIQCFNQCLQIYPEDTVAPTFIKRIAYFKRCPPAANWDGVWRFEEK